MPEGRGTGSHVPMLRAGYLLSVQELGISLQRAKYCPGGRVLGTALGLDLIHMGIAAPSRHIVLEVTRYLLFL